MRRAASSPGPAAVTRGCASYAADDVLPPLPATLADMAREMEAVDALGPMAPATLRQARRLARVFDNSPAVQPARVAALVTVIDLLTRQEVARLEALADTPSMRRLRRRAQAASGLRGRLA